MSRKIINSTGFNTETPKIMWIDLNSAFATAEQQAHPSLRGRPVGVTNRLSKNCCILAASYEAKNRGVKVGCGRLEALGICPDMVVLESDPPKYKHVYQKLLGIMSDYSPNVAMKSIDEGVIDFSGTENLHHARDLKNIGKEIKTRVKREIGDYTMINVGIGTNRFLAKTAAGLNKPDGLDQIDHTNLEKVFSNLKLTDLTGIAQRFEARLNAAGIFTPLEFLAASEFKLRKQVFGGITGLYWYKRLRGFEIDDAQTNLGMIGRQWVVKKPTNDSNYLNPCLHYLAETAGIKLRYRGVVARGICVWVRFQVGGRWKEKRSFKSSFFTNQDIWRHARELFELRPKHMTIMAIGVYLYNLEPDNRSQTSLFDDVSKQAFLCETIDTINDFYGIFTVHSADSLLGKRLIKQKIPFGGTKYFELLLGSK